MFARLIRAFRRDIRTETATNRVRLKCEWLEDRTVPDGDPGLGGMPVPVNAVNFQVNTTNDTHRDHDVTDPTTGVVVNVVDANGNTSLRAVVEYANLHPLNGTWNNNHYNVDLSLIAGQTITLDSNLGFQTLTLNTNFNFLATTGNVSVLRSSAPNTAFFRLMSLAASTESHFTGMTFANGYVTGSGGAILDSGTGQFDGCTFTANRAGGMTGNGGAIAVASGGLLTVGNCTFTNNRADANGGAIAGLQFSLAINIVNSTLTNSNTAGGNGGGVSMIGFIPDPEYPDPNHPAPVGSLSISGSTISISTAAGKGGGVYIETLWSATIAQTTISYNSANLGGGLYVQDSFLSMSGGSLDNNSASLGGGGIYIKADGKTVSFDQTSITLNRATGGKGGGGYLEMGTLSGSLTALTGNTSSVAGFAGIAWKTGSTATITVPPNDPNQQTVVNDP